MSLVAIKGIYQNGQITLEEEITAKEPIAVIVTFLEEKKRKLKRSQSLHNGLLPCRRFLMILW